MNLRMWLHPATQRNVAMLQRDGLGFVGPNDGEMACGEYGPGRMSEPLEIVAAIAAALEADTAIPLPPGIGERSASVPACSPASASSSPPGRRTSRSIPCVISPTAPPASRATPSPRRLPSAGAQVTLISGPVANDPQNVATVHVETAREMLAAVENALPADIFIAAAAVADWRVANVDHIRSSKERRPRALALVENPDILAPIAQPAPAVRGSSSDSRQRRENHRPCAAQIDE